MNVEDGFDLDMDDLLDFGDVGEEEEIVIQQVRTLFLIEFLILGLYEPLSRLSASAPFVSMVFQEKRVPSHLSTSIHSVLGWPNMNCLFAQRIELCFWWTASKKVHVVLVSVGKWFVCPGGGSAGELADEEPPLQVLTFLAWKVCATCIRAQKAKESNRCFRCSEVLMENHFITVRGRKCCDHHFQCSECGCSFVGQVCFGMLLTRRAAFTFFRTDCVWTCPQVLLWSGLHKVASLEVLCVWHANSRQSC